MCSGVGGEDVVLFYFLPGWWDHTMYQAWCQALDKGRRSARIQPHNSTFLTICSGVRSWDQPGLLQEDRAVETSMGSGLGVQRMYSERY